MKARPRIVQISIFYQISLGIKEFQNMMNVDESSRNRLGDKELMEWERS